MLSRKLKRQVFLLEWLNICAIAYYFNYLFFLTRDRFGYTNAENLLLAAVNGFFYIIAAWLGGKFAQKHGYFSALKVGFTVMFLALGTGLVFSSAPAQYLVMIVWTVGTCFTWPALEALAADNETRAGLCRMIGIYNLTWAGGAAVAYFTGGALLHYLGQQSLFYLPMALHATQLFILYSLEKKTKKFGASPSETETIAQELVPHPVPIATAKAFLSMAWLANPSAYVAMNTIIPLLPDLAARFQLSTELAGFAGSVWMFARLAAFLILWRWEGWHYHFNWLAGSFVTMIASFAVLLLAPGLACVIIAQIAFGLAVGLIYYSSLFYSMEVGSTKGEHGGFHEALIGVGLCVGPALGAASLKFGSHLPHVGATTVSILLLLGLTALLILKFRGNSSPVEAVKPCSSKQAAVSAK